MECVEFARECCVQGIKRGTPRPQKVAVGPVAEKGLSAASLLPALWAGKAWLGTQILEARVSSRDLCIRATYWPRAAEQLYCHRVEGLGWVLAVPCYGHLCYAGNVRAQALSVTDSGLPGALSVTAFWNIRDPVRYRFGNRRRCNGAVAEGVTEL